jgi:hypothetical protein
VGCAEGPLAHTEAAGTPFGFRQFGEVPSFRVLGRVHGRTKEENHDMYGFSRAIYRELAEDTLEEPYGERTNANHERVLRACEAAVERLATDRHYFARPARTLFRDIREYFPMSAQLRALRVVEHYMALLDDFVARLPKNGFDVNGNALRCRASTRRGSPCQRMPLPHNGYCPSHQHLADTEELRPRVAARVTTSPRATVAA